MEISIRNISIWSIALPVLCGIFNYKWLNKDSRWIFLLVLVAVYPQINTYYLPQKDPKLYPPYNIYTFVELILLYFVFSTKLESASNKIFLKATLIIHILLCVVFFGLFGISSFHSLLVVYANLSYTIWALLVLREQFLAVDTIIKKNDPFSWFSMAIFIYAVCTIFIFSLHKHTHLKENGELYNFFNSIHGIFNIIMYILFSVGLSIRGQNANAKHIRD